MKQNIRSINCTKTANRHEATTNRVGRSLLTRALLLALLLVLGSSVLLAQQSNRSDEERFAAEMAKAKWRETPMKFSYPDCLGPSQLYDDDVPALYHLYSWHKVVLGYTELGSWAVSEGDYPGPKYPILGAILVKNITYVHKGKGIYSGFTTDGRVFYMKCKPTEGGMVTHLQVLALVYPKSFQKSLDILINQIANW